MEKSRFFNSINGDRKYLAEDFAGYFSGILSNGVFLHQTNALKVSPSSGLTVSVSAGKAYINGYAYENTAALTKTLDAAAATRIDRVVVRLDMVNRNISILVKKGTAATTPTAPVLVRNADTWELGIADIYLASGTTTITAAMITDLRENSAYCGGVTMMVDRDDFLGDITNTFAEFTQASSRNNIATNETMAVVFGKIKKWLADLKALAFLATVGTSQIDSNAVTTAKIKDGAITNAKIASDAAIAQSKIDGLVAALAAKLEANGAYPNLTAGAATNATNDANGLSIAGNYLRLKRLANADSAYNAKTLSGRVSWNITAPSNSSDFIFVHGMLTCVYKYQVSAILKRSNPWGYAWDGVVTMFVRNANGTPNVSYGFVSMEFEVSGNILQLSAFHPQLNGGYEGTYASECAFALEGVYEIINSNV